MIDWLPAGDKAVPYLGVQSGLFAAEGLDVTIQSGRGSSDVVTKLGTGAADMGTGGLAALLQARAKRRFRSKPSHRSTRYSRTPVHHRNVRNFQHQGCRRKDHRHRDVLVVERGVAAPAQDERRRCVQGPIAQGRSRRVGPMLASGKVAATINWVTVAPAFGNRWPRPARNSKLIMWSDYGFDGYGLSVFASEKMLKRTSGNGEEVHARLCQGDGHGDRRSAAAAKAVHAMAPEVDVAVARDQFAASIPLMVNSISKKDGQGAFEKGLLAKTWKWTAEAQNMPLDKIDPEKAVDRSFLPK